MLDISDFERFNIETLVQLITTFNFDGELELRVLIDKMAYGDDIESLVRFVKLYAKIDDLLSYNRMIIGR